MAAIHKKPGIQADKTLASRIISNAHYNAYLSEALKSNSPLLVCRIGGVEGQITYPLVDRSQDFKFSEGLLQQAKVNAGINRNSLRYLKRLACRTATALTNADAVGLWNYIYQAELVKWSGCPRVVMLQHMNPVTSNLDQEPWTISLAGKRVLVVLPFPISLKIQFQKIVKGELLAGIWPRDVELIQFQPPVTFAGLNHSSDWHDELLDTCARLSHVEFDVALVAAGGYGILIADYIKLMGKQAIHIGGSLQLLFGIMGKRWLANRQVTRHVTASWVSPCKEEVPPLHYKVDSSSYF